MKETNSNKMNAYKIINDNDKTSVESVKLGKTLDLSLN